MRIAVISDIHGNIRALEAVLGRVRALGDIDRLVVAGRPALGSARAVRDRRPPEVARGRGHPRQPRAPAARLRRGARWGERPVRLRAHHRRRSGRGWPRSRRRSSSRPTCWSVTARPETDLVYLCEELDGGPVRLASDRIIVGRLGGARHALVLSGHSHHPRTVRLSSGQLVVNAGSVGLQAFTAELPHPHHVENGSPHARFVVCERTPQRLAGRAASDRLRLGRRLRDRGRARSAGLGALAPGRAPLSARVGAQAGRTSNTWCPAASMSRYSPGPASSPPSRS